MTQRDEPDPTRWLLLFAAVLVLAAGLWLSGCGP